MQIEEVILHFLEGENEGVEIKLTPIRELNIGRSEESDVFLGEKKISRRHCQIHVEEDRVRLVDLESTNGTFVNGKKATEVDLHSKDKIKVGSSIIEIKIISSGSDEKSKSKSKSGPKPTPPKSSSAPKKPKIEEQSEPSLGDDLDELGEDEPSRPKQKEVDDDSDLVVEYQTAIKDKPVESDTSEKIDVTKAKEKKEVEPEPAQEEFEEISLDAGSDMQEVDVEVSQSSSRKEHVDEPSFNKIPDLDQFNENSDIDLSEEEDKPASRSTKPLMGDLSSMGLADLLQNLYQNKKTGILKLSNDSYSGNIYIREGSLMGVECGKSVGLKAIYRMLTWKTGDFEFRSLSPDAKELRDHQTPFEESMESILMEGFRQFDELKKIQKVLPQLEDELVLEEKLEVPISKLHPKVLDVVQLVINHRKMKSVLDLSPFSDLETAKIVFYLIKKKVIRIRED